jgi:DNA polymerase-1
MRVRCKALNFGVGYGAEKDIIHEQILKAALEYPELHIVVPDLNECRHLISEYWKAYPEVREYRDFIHALIQERGYSATMYGRRRQLPLINSSVPELRSRAQRQGWNLVIQGTAGDIMKNAELMVDREAPKYHADLRSQVHDELLGLVEYPYINEWLLRVSQLMVLDQPIMPVPLKVQAHAGPTWLEAK